MYDNYSNTVYVQAGAKPIKLGFLIAGDSEALRFKISTGERQEFFNCDFFNGNEHTTLYDLNDVYNYLNLQVKIYDKITVLFHNLKYDMQIIGLIKYITEKKFFELNLVKCYTSGVYYIKFSSKNRNRSIEFIDTMNYFRMSIEDMGKVLGIKKLDVSDYKLSPKKWNEKLMSGMGQKRAEIDTEILYKYSKNFFENKEIVLGLSTSGTAFKTYRQKYMPVDKVSIPKTHIEPALKSYRGGRCEPYIISPQPQEYYYYDINNLYGTVMRDKKYSIKFRKEVDKINYDAIENNNYNYLFNISYVYQGKANEKPVRLPIVLRNKDNRLVQSYNATNIWLTGQEVLEMYKQYDNLLIMLHKGYEYLNEYLFTDYIQHFYDLRQSAPPEEKDTYKLMNNGLYGKWAQHKQHSKIIGINDLEEYILAILYDKENVNKNMININGINYTLHGSYVTLNEIMPEEKTNNILIGSEITANARLLNFEFQKQIGFKNIAYTDTDSFISKREWVTGNKLGQLKEVHKYGKYIINDAKDYIYIDDQGYEYRTQKGIHKKQAKKWDTFKVEIYNKEHHTNYEEIYTQPHFSSLNTVGHTGNTVLIKNQIKKVKRKHLKLDYRLEDNKLIGYPFEKI